MDSVVYNVPSPIRLYCYRGTTNNILVTINACSDKLNLTGDTVQFIVKRRLSDQDGAAVINKTASIIDPVEGLVKVTLNPSDTINFPDYYYEYGYEIRVTDSGGNKTVTGTGTLGVYPTVFKGP